LRQVDEWRGKTDDTPIPPRVRDRIFERCGGRCHRCKRVINAQAGEWWMVEHTIAIANGGENRESNCCLTCEWCKPGKDAEDMAIKKRSTQARYRARGIKSKSALRATGLKWSNAQGRYVERKT